MKIHDNVSTRIRKDVAQSLGWEKQGRFWVVYDHRKSWAAQWDYDGIPSYMEDWTTDLEDAKNLLLKLPEGTCNDNGSGKWITTYTVQRGTCYFIHYDQCMSICLAWLDYYDEFKRGYDEYTRTNARNRSDMLFSEGY